MMASQPMENKVELDKAFVKLLAATDSNFDELNMIAQVYQNPNLRQKVKEAYDLQEKVRRNQIVGEKVEHILRVLLGKALPEDKFKVYKIRKGADIGIDVDFEYDLLDQNYQPVALGINLQSNSFVIEVKSTHSNHVRITMSQAKEAVEKLDNFMLCVVEIPPEFDQFLDEKVMKLVQETAKFILRVGSRLEDKFIVAQQFQKKQEEIKSETAGNVRIDTTDVQLRLRLNKKLWIEEDLPVLSFEQLVTTLTKTYN